MGKVVTRSFMMVGTAALALTLAMPVFAQGMMGWQNGVNQAISADSQQTAQDEAAGTEIWSKLKAGTLACGDLKEDDFDVLGDYFMRLMVGDTGSHDAMNRAMAQRLGDSGEKQMHVAMGKRLSGCDATAAIPAGGSSYWPMMYGGTTSGGMMYGAYGAGLYPGTSSWISMITVMLTLTALVLVIIVLLIWISKQKK